MNSIEDCFTEIIEDYISERIDFLFTVETMREKIKKGGLIPYSVISENTNISSIKAAVFNDKKNLKDDVIDFSKAIGFDDETLKYYPIMNLITGNANCYSCVEYDLRDGTSRIFIFILNGDGSLGINVSLNTDGTFSDFDFYGC